MRRHARDPPAYVQRRPQDTALYQLVADNLETFLAEVEDTYDGGLPDYVEQELRKYVECGIHAYGFARAYCRDCGKELLLPFSCKRRGICPSCNARRMCGTAAFLTDYVFPEVPVRQWVLSVPFELRMTLARYPDALSAVNRIFVDAVFEFQRQRAVERGENAKRLQGAAVSFPQRFGGSLNLNVHYHAAIPDGVFVLDRGSKRARFVNLSRPTQPELRAIAEATEQRVLLWLGRKGYLKDEAAEDADDSAPQRSALEWMLQGSVGIGELVALREAPAPDPEEEFLPRPTKAARRGGRARGFDVHAAVWVAANDRKGRERLLRYCARPPLSLERLSVLEDGRVAYAVRKPWRGQTHRVMTPVEFLARLAALVPPPRHPLVRFHGAFAPHSSFRSKVVPERAIAAPPPPKRATRQPPEPDVAPQTPVTPLVSTQPSSSAPPPAGVGSVLLREPCALERVPSEGEEPERTPRLPAQRAPGGLLENEPRPRGPCSYLDWAELLKRTHDVDALRCPCGGRYRFVQLFTASQDAREALEKRGLDHQPPPIARARAPDLLDVPADHYGDIPPPDCFTDPPAPDCIDPLPADW